METRTSNTDFFNFKSKDEKNKILSWITEKKIECDNMEIENLVDIISCCKTNLNEILTYCMGLQNVEKNNQLFSAMIKGKNKKIDNLIDLYNNANTYNKIYFNNNKILFPKTTFIKSLQIEFENFDFFYPINYKMYIYTYDQMILEYDILPYNYSGLYSEYFDKDKNESTFKVANKNTIYIYNCLYNEKGFQLGEELKLNYKKQYGFKDDHLILDRELIPYNDLVVKYQPGEENSFKFEINKKIAKIELEAINDKLSLDKKIKKKLVIL